MARAIIFGLIASAAIIGVWLAVLWACGLFPPRDGDDQ